jgi:hypothetical protein
VFIKQARRDEVRAGTEAASEYNAPTQQVCGRRFVSPAFHQLPERLIAIVVVHVVDCPQSRTAFKGG